MIGLIEHLVHAGRLGGGIATALGMAMLGFCAYDWEIHGGFFVAIAGIGFILTLFGLAILIFGNPATKGSFKELEARPTEELLAAIEGRGFPYTICLKKRDIVELENLTDDEVDVRGALHLHCNAQLDHIEVTSVEDLQIALASLG